jgi:hypothetical protein
MLRILAGLFCSWGNFFPINLGVNVLKFNLIQSPPYPEGKMGLRVSRTLAHSKRQH